MTRIRDYSSKLRWQSVSMQIFGALCLVVVAYGAGHLWEHREELTASGLAVWRCLNIVMGCLIAAMSWDRGVKLDAIADQVQERDLLIEQLKMESKALDTATDALGDMACRHDEEIKGAREQYYATKIELGQAETARQLATMQAEGRKDIIQSIYEATLLAVSAVDDNLIVKHTSTTEDQD